MFSLKNDFRSPTKIFESSTTPLIPLSCSLYFYQKYYANEKTLENGALPNPREFQALCILEILKFCSFILCVSIGVPCICAYNSSLLLELKHSF